MYVLTLYVLTLYVRTHTVRSNRCWTQGKADKLIYLEKVKMWYLTDTCSSLASLTTDGVVLQSIAENADLGSHSRWSHLSSLCCQKLPGAP